MSTSRRLFVLLLLCLLLLSSTVYCRRPLYISRDVLTLALHVLQVAVVPRQDGHVIFRLEKHTCTKRRKTQSPVRASKTKPLPSRLHASMRTSSSEARSRVAEHHPLQWILVVGGRFAKVRLNLLGRSEGNGRHEFVLWAVEERFEKPNTESMGHMTPH